MSKFNPYIEQIARAALGEPNRQQSTRANLRFGTKGSKSVEISGENQGAYYDHEAGTGGGPVELVRDALGLDFKGAMKWLERETGLESDFDGARVEPVLRNQPCDSAPKTKTNGSAAPPQVYPYRNAKNEIVYSVVRRPDKSFRQCRTDQNGEIVWSIKDIERLPYRLPDFYTYDDEPVFITEGEKDADRLAACGLLATCNSGGANNWDAALNKYFAKRDVFILPDNDEPGRKHADAVRDQLMPIANTVTIVALAGLPDKGDVSDWLDVDGNDADKLREIAQRAQGTAKRPFALRPLGILAPRERAPREFVVPFRMMRGHVTMTAAAPGVGKSTIAIEEAVSLAIGDDFLGLGIDQQRRVGVINNEETRAEIERRIEATCQAFGIQFADIADRRFVHSGVDDEKFLISRDIDGDVVHTPHKQTLREMVGDLDLDVVVVDPFVQSHAVSESSNEAISQVMVGLRETLTAGRGAALHLVHHNRKPMAGNSHQAGDLYAARGASSMQGEAHFVFTLADMDNDSQRAFGIDDDARGRYVRLDDAKSKMAPPSGAKWFQRHGEAMRRSNGDIEEIGILKPWQPPDFRLDITETQRNEILKYVHESWSRGQPLAQQARGRKFAELVPQKFPYATRAHARELLNEWLRDGVLVTETLADRNKTQGLRVQNKTALETRF